jgi:hypothetical protein
MMHTGLAPVEPVLIHSACIDRLAGPTVWIFTQARFMRSKQQMNKAAGATELLSRELQRGLDRTQAGAMELVISTSSLSFRVHDRTLNGGTMTITCSEQAALLHACSALLEGNVQGVRQAMETRNDEKRTKDIHTTIVK